MDLIILEHYTMGVEQLDKEHLSLFTLTNEIIGALDDRTASLALIEEFRRLSQVHYDNEDAYMVSIGYPYYQGHHDEHIRVMYELREQIYSITTYTTLKIQRQYIQDIAGSFLKHIDTYDMQLADYVKNNPPKA